MRNPVRDEKGNYLYKFIASWKDQGITMVRVDIIKRKKPIKRFGVVLNNLTRKYGLWGCYESVCLEPYEQWDYERNNPV
mgnify:CR=1 FL=1